MPTYLLNYHELAERLEESSWDLKTDFEPRRAAREREYEEALLEEADELRGKLDLAVLHWISKGEFPSLSPRETFFLRLRFQGACRFLYQFQLEDGSTVFRVDGMKEKNFLIWLLTQWGHDVGIYEGFDALVSSWNTPDIEIK